MDRRTIIQLNEPIAQLTEAASLRPCPTVGVKGARSSVTEFSAVKDVPNTLEMFRTILKNAGGEEKSVDELRQLIS